MVFRHHLTKVHNLAMVIVYGLHDVMCNACHLQTRQALSEMRPIRLKKPKQKGMPSHSLPSLAHTYTLPCMKDLSCSFQSSRLLSLSKCFVKVSHIVAEVKMPTFVAMNCVELLEGSRVEVSACSYCRKNSVLLCMTTPQHTWSVGMRANVSHRPTRHCFVLHSV